MTTYLREMDIRIAREVYGLNVVSEAYPCCADPESPGLFPASNPDEYDPDEDWEYGYKYLEPVYAKDAEYIMTFPEERYKEDRVAWLVYIVPEYTKEPYLAEQLVKDVCAKYDVSFHLSYECGNSGKWHPIFKRRDLSFQAQSNFLSLAIGAAALAVVDDKWYGMGNFNLDVEDGFLIH